MPVSVERDMLFGSTTWPPCIRSQVTVVRSGLRLRIAAPVLMPLLHPTSREYGIADGLAGSHSGHSEGRDAEAEHPADAAV